MRWQPVACVATPETLRHLSSKHNFMILWQRQTVAIQHNHNNNKMGEETGSSTQNKTRAKTTRPKAVYQWTVVDVQKWYRRHCGEYTKYESLFAKHDITGRALLRITDSSLQRMGVTDNRDREAIWREIVKQRLKTDIMEIRDMERLNTH